jgi:hypothetical protein
MKARITIQDWQLLSAYMDDQLAPQEKQALELRLQKDPALQAEWQSLRQTRAMLRAAPKRKAPRSFALSAEQARLAARRKSIFFPILSFSSAISTLLLILTLLLRLTPAGSLTAMSADMAAPQAEMMAAEPAAAQESIPPIIIWGESNLQPPVFANGRGGSGGGGDPSSDTILSPIEPPVSTPLEKAADEESMQPLNTQAAEMPAPMQAESAQQPEMFAGDAQPGNPILGIAPEEEQGQITGYSATAVSPETLSTGQTRSRALFIETAPYVLAVLALGSALTAFFLRRKGVI